MKSFVSALGMATAGFAVVGSAGAADLPSRKAAPVEYVRVCTAYGAGFFYLPGTAPACASAVVSGPNTP